MAIALGEAVDAGCDGGRVISRSLEGGHGRIWEALQDTSVMQSYAISNMAMVRYLKRKSKATTGGAGCTSSSVAATVKDVIDAIRSRRDAAVREYSQKFDTWSPIIDDIKAVQVNVRNFAQAQRESTRDFEVETQPGVFLSQKNVPISSVGAYIPGDRYPLLASAHMTILTAKVAGVQHVIGCTPPVAGQIPSGTVAAMALAGADEIFILGGTIRKVDFIAGPGNAFVAEGKRQLFGEILIVADDAADPFTMATDLLSWAKHGPDSPAVLITTLERVGHESMAIVDELLKNLPTTALAGTSWKHFGEVVVVDSLGEAWKLADEYAFEHALEKMRNYGALFLGEKTWVIGTNHILPTRKAARYTGGLRAGKFLRTVTYQEMTSESSSIELGRLCGRAARAENFEGHARSGDLRAHKYFDDKYGWIADYSPA
ncbi:histidinol dehydrogenase [Cenococcum geophilum 1.58]|uniref:histidinol dehydrogenase n=1 Tax=Cenococcum geophilum 1.58 TaxID=794803 RepID=UPI00358EE575|nr:histidinol dehydrogenase [Cenococcum geophilum 1.58]